EAGGGLVGEEHLEPVTRAGERDHDPLELALAELERVGGELSAAVDPDVPQQLQRPGVELLAVLVWGEAFEEATELAADRPRRIERVDRILRDERHLDAAHAAVLLARQGTHVPA